MHTNKPVDAPETTNVLYLTYDGLTDALGQSQIMPYLTGLSEKGISITILSAEKPQLLESKKQEIEQHLYTYGINWIPTKYTKKPPLISTFRDLLKLKRTAFKLCSTNKFDIAHCRSYPTSVVGLKLKKKFGLKFIFDMRGFWADERIDGNIWKLSNPLHKLLYKYVKRQEKKFLIHSDHIVSLTNAGVSIIQTGMTQKLPDSKFSVIPCCADLTHFNNTKNTKATRHKERHELQIPETAFVLTYLGSTGTWYMLDEMLHFFKILQQKFRNDACLLIITKDDQKTIHRQLPKHDIMSESVKTVSVNRWRLPEILTVSDAAISFIKPAFSKKASSPTKVAELFGLGIPVFSNHHTGDIEQQYETIPELLVKNFDANTYQKILEHFFQNQKSLPQKVIDIANNYFSLTMGVEKYLKIYQKL